MKSETYEKIGKIVVYTAVFKLIRSTNNMYKTSKIILDAAKEAKKEVEQKEEVKANETLD